MCIYKIDRQRCGAKKKMCIYKIDRQRCGARGAASG